MLEFLITFITGGAIGIFTIAILKLAGNDDERNGRK